MIDCVFVMCRHSISPHAPGVLSVCCMQAGNTTNVIPHTATLKGTIRDFHPDVGTTLLQRLKEVAINVAAAFGCEANVIATDSYPSIVNSSEPTEFVAQLCNGLFGEGSVLRDVAPMPGGEVLAFCCIHVN